jgi:hypothetical protein
VDEKIEKIVNKYLYHSQFMPRVLVLIGLCKLLIAKRLHKQEYILSRILVVLYKSFEIKDEASEDYHMKISEIVSDFLYYYCTFEKTQLKSVINAILIILTGQMIGEFFTSSFEKNSVLNHYMETKIEFISQIIILIQEKGEESKYNIKRIIFKIIKHLAHLALFMLDSTNKKSFKFTITNMKNFQNNLKRFFEKSNFDQFILNGLDEKYCTKLYAILLNLKLSDISLSESFDVFLHSIQNNECKYTITEERVIDFADKTCQLGEYVAASSDKYYKVIGEYIYFLNKLKKTKMGVIVEELNESTISDYIASSAKKSKIIPSDDEEEGDLEEISEDDEQAFEG